MKNMKTKKFGILLSALLLAAMVIVPCASAYQASSYGPQYTNWNFGPAAVTAANELNAMGYASTPYTGSPGASTARTRMSSDNVFFFDGHGGAGLLEFPDSFITGTDTGFYPHLAGSSGQLSDVVLAVYMACNTANPSDTYGNVAYQSLVEGVDMSLGWTNTINSVQSEYWSGRFWYWLDEGCSVKIASQRATSDTSTAYGDLGGMDGVICRSNGNCAMTIDPARAGY
jgi:hypothetical protein